MTNEILVNRIRTGDSSLMMDLWTQNKGIVYKTARRYTNDFVDLDDLAQEGYIIMDKAVQTWNPDKCSFVVWLVHALEWGFYRYIKLYGDNPISQTLLNEVIKYSSTVRRFTDLTGREPTEREIRIYTGMSKKSLEAVKRIMNKPISLDEPVTDEGATLHDIIPDEMDLEAEAIERADNELLHKALDEAMESTLPLFHADVIKRRYYQNQSIEEIATETGANRKEIQNISNAAMRYLRHSRNVKRQLRPFVQAYEYGVKGVSLKRFNETGTSSTERAAFKLCGCTL